MSRILPPRAFIEPNLSVVGAPGPGAGDRDARIKSETVSGPVAHRFGAQATHQVCQQLPSRERHGRAEGRPDAKRSRAVAMPSRTDAKPSRTAAMAYRPKPVAQAHATIGARVERVAKQRFTIASRCETVASRRYRFATILDPSPPPPRSSASAASVSQSRLDTFRTGHDRARHRRENVASRPRMAPPRPTPSAPRNLR